MRGSFKTLAVDRNMESAKAGKMARRRVPFVSGRTYRCSSVPGKIVDRAVPVSLVDVAMKVVVGPSGIAAKLLF
jgi:hypothetical protein